MAKPLASRHLAALAALLLAAAASAADDVARANSRDAAWYTAWSGKARTLLASPGKTAGFVLQVGDSITHANPYKQWPHYGSGKTAADTATASWCNAGSFPGTVNDTTSTNGWYLASADTSGYRGMTASSGLDCAEFLSGSGQPGTAMPADTSKASARSKLADGATYTGNLHATTVAAAFDNAQIAVLMLGTNDVDGGRATASILADLGTIIDRFEAKSILVVLSTIPPLANATKDAAADTLNAGIRSLAQTRDLPLIDFNAEIHARRPGTTWQGTLISGDGIHPTASSASYNSSSDPYAAGGDAASGRTGAACTEVGYLLRSWLTMQKLTQIRTLPAGANLTPVVSAGPDRTITQPAAASLDGTVTDDALPAGLVTVAWSLVSGPGTVAFTAGSAVDTTATFSAAGTYTLRLTASDGEKSASDTMSVVVQAASGGGTPPSTTSSGDGGGGCGGGSGGAALAGLLLLAPLVRRRRSLT